MKYQTQPNPLVLREMAEGGNYFSIPEGYLAGAWIVEAHNVNIDDLVSAGARSGGRIVRVQSQDAIRYIPPSMDDYARIAGMVSDAA